MGYPELPFILAYRALQRTNNQNQKFKSKNSNQKPFFNLCHGERRGKELFTSEIGLGLYILDLSCVGSELTVEGRC
jgi:hypothetical protein